MAKFSLHIETDDLHELHTLTSRLAQAGSAAPVNAVYAPSADEYKAMVEREQSYQADNTAREAMQEKRTRTRKTEVTAAPVAEVVAAAPLSEASAPATTFPAPSTEAPAATATTSAAAASSGERVVSYEEVKAALSKLMEAKSAKVAQETLKKSVGFGSLSSTPPEKYWLALDAINVELGV
jgi:hypothetical protein